MSQKVAGYCVINNLFLKKTKLSWFLISKIRFSKYMKKNARTERRFSDHDKYL